MPHKYKLRTAEEAMELARERFRAEVRNSLTDEEIEIMRRRGTVTNGSVTKGDWIEEFGGEPDQRLHYEIEIYLPSDECPYIERRFARILVTRDRNSDRVWIKWKPPVPEYNGPFFT